MAKAPQPTVDEAAGGAEQSASTTQIMLLCDHVYLPEDPTVADWAARTDTKRYEGKDGKNRVRLRVHPELAAFLKDREQAEIL